MKLTLESNAQEKITWDVGDHYTLEQTFAIVSRSLHFSEEINLIAVDDVPATEDQKALWVGYAGHWSTVQEVNIVHKYGPDPDMRIWRRKEGDGTINWNDWDLVVMPDGEAWFVLNCPCGYGCTSNYTVEQLQFCAMTRNLEIGDALYQHLWKDLQSQLKCPRCKA